MIISDRIIEILPEPELLAALAEECSELAQAALKLRRFLDGTNWTPKTRIECIDSVWEELGDVLACLVAAGFLTEEQPVRDFLSKEKADRWLARLEAHRKEAQP